MKKLTILFASVSFACFAQNWQTIPVGFYSSIPFLTWEKGDIDTRFSQHFKINKFDNSFWGMHESKVMRLDNGGTFQLWDESNTTLFQLGDFYTDINFSSTYTYLVSQNTKLFKYDGAAWGILSNADKGLNLAVDADTLWVAKLNQDYLKIVNSTNISFGSIYAHKMASKNGFTVLSNSYFSGSLIILTEPTYVQLDPALHPYYLDYKNYDFKFSPFSDTLFTSGDRGFSLAVNGVFVDTITKYNTTNMPNLAITEFEFDKQGNIWAVFAPPAFNAIISNEKIGFLDRSTNTWSQFFDESNSPIDFPRVSIEIDTNGNLWVANRKNLHVLNTGTLPNWLSTIDVSKTNSFVRIFPNPNLGKIELEASFAIAEIIVYDLLGKVILTCESVHQFSLPKGVFIISIKGENGEKHREKVVVE